MKHPWVVLSAVCCCLRRVPRRLDRFDDGIEVVTQPCPGLVDQIEAGGLDDPTTRTMIERFTAPLWPAVPT